MITANLSDSPYHELPQKNDYLEIEISGLGTMTEYGDGRTVLVEFYQGRWWVRVWADINQEDPTHVIDLSGALHEHRTHDRNHYGD
jgi:hypothetical protein